MDLTVHSLKQLPTTEAPLLGESVIQQYTLDLLLSGRDDAETVDSLEQYFTNLAGGFEEELHRIQQQTDLHKAAARELEAHEVVIPASDNDDLSNFFLECVYQQRKSLRHQLLTMKSIPAFSGDRSKSIETAARKTVANVYNNSLLNIYINTVKTGSQEEIEQFSQIEKQKLVQLLSANNELLGFMFDKMFKNTKKPPQKGAT
jgi:glutamate/tyrosine decarboxylase-like PLP-dependent enzyme